MFQASPCGFFPSRQTMRSDIPIIKYEPRPSPVRPPHARASDGAARGGARCAPPHGAGEHPSAERHRRHTESGRASAVSGSPAISETAPRPHFGKTDAETDRCGESPRSDRLCRRCSASCGPESRDTEICKANTCGSTPDPPPTSLRSGRSRQLSSPTVPDTPAPTIAFSIRPPRKKLRAGTFDEGVTPRLLPEHAGWRRSGPDSKPAELPVRTVMTGPYAPSRTATTGRNHRTHPPRCTFRTDSGNGNELPPSAPAAPRPPESELERHFPKKRRYPQRRPPALPEIGRHRRTRSRAHRHPKRTKRETTRTMCGSFLSDSGNKRI